MSQNDAARNRLHALVALALALLLAILWLSGFGPGHAASAGTCCGGGSLPTAVAVTAPDADGDAVSDDLDECPATPAGNRVGVHGCSCDVTVQLQYEFDSERLTAADLEKLDALVPQLRALNFVSGEVGGYADDVGEDAYNLELSKRRAQAALEFLAGKGIAVGRMTSVGYGEQSPIADNFTAEGRALNRRVVLRRTDCIQ